MTQNTLWIYILKGSVIIGTILQLILSTLPTNLSEAILSQHDNILVTWKTIPESHREQSLQGSQNERRVCGIAIPLLLYLPLLMVELHNETLWT